MPKGRAKHRAVAKYPTAKDTTMHACMTMYAGVPTVHSLIAVVQATTTATCERDSADTSISAPTMPIAAGTPHTASIVIGLVHHSSATFSPLPSCSTLK